MDRFRTVLIVFSTTVSGFLGGVIAVWMFGPLAVDAQEGVPDVIMAREFHVIDDEGTVRARLGWERKKLDVYGPQYQRTYLEFLDAGFWSEEDEEQKLRQMNLEHTEGGWYMGPTRTLTFRGVGAPVRSEGTLAIGDLGRKGYVEIGQIDEDRSAAIGPSEISIASGKDVIWSVP